MQFTSVSFLLFAAVTLLGYYLFPKKARWVWLLAASMFFYLMAGVEYLAFILLTVVSTYLAGLLMDKNLSKQEKYLAENKQSLSREEKKEYKARIKGRNRVIMVVCLVVNFAVLGLCKFLLAEPFATMVQGTGLYFRLPHPANARSASLRPMPLLVNRGIP